MPPLALREKVTDLLTRTRSQVHRLRPRGAIDIRRHDVVVLKLFWRSISLFDGTFALLKEDLAEEAMILGRSLFVEALRLAEIEEAGDDRTALVLGWANSSIKEKKGLIEEASKLGLEKEKEIMLSHLDDEQKGLQAYARRKGVGKLRKFLHVRDAAARYGREHDYWSYSFGHEVVHGSDTAFLFRRKKVDNDTVAISNRTPDPEIIAGVASFAAKSVVQAARAAANVFGWQDGQQLQQLSKEIDELANGLRNGG